MAGPFRSNGGNIMSGIFEYTKRGYDPKAVEEYVQQTEDFIAQLKNTLRASKEKEYSLGVMVEEYEKELNLMNMRLETARRAQEATEEALERGKGERREKEMALNHAMLNAQVSANSIIKNAEETASTIILDAKKQIELVNKSCAKHLTELLDSVSPLHNLLAEIRREYAVNFAALDDKITNFKSTIKEMLVEGE